jgi:hypothetical protein
LIRIVHQESFVCCCISRLLFNDDFESAHVAMRNNNCVEWRKRWLDRPHERLRLQTLIQSISTVVISILHI